MRGKAIDHLSRLKPWLVSFLALAGLAACAAVDGRAETPANGPAVSLPPVVFEGFGFGEFTGSGSLAAAVRGAVQRDGSAALPLDIMVRGPTGRDAVAEQLATEIRSRIEQLDVSAGVVTTRTSIHDGFAAWTGGVAMASEHATGRDILELRTSLTQAQQSGVLGIEVGPRIERRLRRGAVLFLDGKAEARTQRSVETGGWLLPSEAAQGMVGVAARTGLTR